MGIKGADLKDESKRAALAKQPQKEKTTAVNMAHLVCRKQYALGRASARLLTGQNLVEVWYEQVLAY